MDAVSHHGRHRRCVLSGYYAERPLAEPTQSAPDSAEPKCAERSRSTAAESPQLQSTHRNRSSAHRPCAPFRMCRTPSSTPTSPRHSPPSCGRKSASTAFATDAVQPAPDRTVQPGEIPGANAFYEKAPDWRLVISCVTTASISTANRNRPLSRPARADTTASMGCWPM